jgi:hypothetical protein
MRVLLTLTACAAFGQQRRRISYLEGMCDGRRYFSEPMMRFRLSRSNIGRVFIALVFDVDAMQ